MDADAYKLARASFIHDYLIALGPRWCSAEAAAAVALGEAHAHGASPVSIPGAGMKAR